MFQTTNQYIYMYRYQRMSGPKHNIVGFFSEQSLNCDYQCFPCCEYHDIVE